MNHHRLQAPYIWQKIFSYNSRYGIFPTGLLFWHAMYFQHCPVFPPIFQSPQVTDWRTQGIKYDSKELMMIDCSDNVSKWKLNASRTSEVQVVLSQGPSWRKPSDRPHLILYLTCTDHEVLDCRRTAVVETCWYQGLHTAVGWCRTYNGLYFTTHRTLKFCLLSCVFFTENLSQSATVNFSELLWHHNV